MNEPLPDPAIERVASTEPIRGDGPGPGWLSELDIALYRFIALQRYAGGSLQADVEEFLARLDIGVAGVADDDPRCLESCCGNAGEAAAFEQGAYR